jgi:choline dehydrogenase-like flavoprotein
MRTQPRVVVIGSGAGGAVTALELVSRGLDVTMIEEGRRTTLDDYGGESPKAMQSLYRSRGMTPILGGIPIAYVEGCVVGGSTEINSGFWHRTPREVLINWQARYGLADASPADLTPHFLFAEELLHVGLAESWPKSTKVFKNGVDAMGWSAQEVPRAAKDCKNTNTCAQGCPRGAKQGMSRSLIPLAEAAGVRIVPRCRAKLLLREGLCVTGVLADLTQDDGTIELARFDADYVFVCCGPTETPALLRRSGFRLRVGDTLRIHPALKVVARFREELDAATSVLPLLQVKEFWPEITLGGAFFSLGHLAMQLSENWPTLRPRMRDHAKMATYYIAVKGTGRGSVRSSLWGDSTIMRYGVSNEDIYNLSRGLARLSELLLAAGAEEVYPGLHGTHTIRTEVDAVRWLDERLPRKALSLTTVHAFASCPIGERRDLCAANSYGKVFSADKLYINDASMLPDSPGVNPQGSVMAFARRNAQHFVETLP